MGFLGDGFTKGRLREVWADGNAHFKCAPGYPPISIRTKAIIGLLLLGLPWTARQECFAMSLRSFNVTLVGEGKKWFGMS